MADIVPVNRARQITLLVLAAVVVAFGATWLTMPTEKFQKVDKPASFFASGLTESRRLLGGNHQVDVEALERRVFVLFASTAAVVILVGLAFGAGRQRDPA